MEGQATRVREEDIDALLRAPGCPVSGHIDGGDWVLPVEEFVAFALAHRGATSASEVRDAVDAYALARGGLRGSVRPAFPRAPNAAGRRGASALRRLPGRPPIAPGEVWMFPQPALPPLPHGAGPPAY